MNFTVTTRTSTVIAEESSAIDRVLSQEDFEAFLDDLNDALVVQEVGDITVGASLRDGWAEVVFTLDAGNLFEAQQRGIAHLSMANAVAMDRMKRRLGAKADGGDVPGLEMRSLDTHTEATTLVSS